MATKVPCAHPQDNAPSHYGFTLNRKYSHVTGKAAINDVQSVDRAQKPQLFTIYGDKRLLWKSRPLQEKLDAEEFSVNVTTLHFYVTGGGHARCVGKKVRRLLPDHRCLWTKPHISFVTNSSYFRSA